MAEEPTVPTPLDAIDLELLSEDELQRLIQLLMRERERRMGLEPGSEDPVWFSTRDCRGAERDLGRGLESITAANARPQRS
jgi:hypothetical protein